MRYINLVLQSGLFMGCMAPTLAHANEPSTTLYGPLGLNTVPNARMDPAGTIRAGISTLDPYINSWLSFQLADPLAVTIRQSGEVSNINDDADRLYPGVDFKLRLLEENATRPEIAIGAQSAIGHKRMAGEYLALSKRYNNFDFTAGLGWGRYGSAAHFKNPLSVFGNHFDKRRALDGENPVGPENWFTGQDVGVFGGVEYFTPFVDGLSLKLDYGADRFEAEHAAFDFETPAPWSVGLNYKPASWVDFSLAAQGTDKVMARISFQGNLKNWPDKLESTQPNGTPFQPFRTELTKPEHMHINAIKNGVMLSHLKTYPHRASAALTLHNNLSTPFQIGQAAKFMSNSGGPEIEELEIQPVRMGLYGPKIKLIRRDLENAAARENGSPEEIWHNAEFIPVHDRTFKKQRGNKMDVYGLKDTYFALDNQASLAEEDSGTLYRSSLIAGTQGPSLFGWLDSFFSLRLNLVDNLDRLTDIRPRSFLPVRSDIDRFADQRIAIDTAYDVFTHSFRSDLHLSLMNGYLEEQYAGAGGEILYRPFDARWAIGAESFLAFKRDPNTVLNLGLNGDALISGHVQGWYDLPYWDLTMNARFGRHLAEDIGGTLALQKRFDNGVYLEAYSTITDQNDFDLFGGTTHADHGIRLNIPLGGFKHIPRNTHIKTKLAPFGRDIGQRLENPLPLYDVTESFSARHMAAQWSDIAP